MMDKNADYFLARGIVLVDYGTISVASTILAFFIGWPLFVWAWRYALAYWGYA